MFFASALAICLFALPVGAALAAAEPATPVTATPAAPATLSEAQKIQALIHGIEVMKDARFVRNGSDYDGAAAADHLRLKLRNAGDKIKTAQDFITYLASTSSMSGKPYLIRFNDGHEVESGTYLRAMLTKIEHPVAVPKPVAVVSSPVPVVSAPLVMSEPDKIQFLIRGVELMKSAKFVRDGHSYTVAQAADYFRRKLQHETNRNITARDFVDNDASRGTRGPNSFRLPNGQLLDAGQYFHDRLAILERGASAARPIVIH
jgi:hypothetical protein